MERVDPGCFGMFSDSPLLLLSTVSSCPTPSPTDVPTPSPRGSPTETVCEDTVFSNFDKDGFGNQNEAGDDSFLLHPSEQHWVEHQQIEGQ